MNRSHHQKPAMLKTLLLLVVSLSCAVHSLAQTDTTTNDGPALNEETVAVTENSAEQEDSPDPTIAQDDVSLQLRGNNLAAKKATEQFKGRQKESPRNSKKLQGTPRNFEVLQGAQRNSEETRGTPRSLKNSKELQGTMIMLKYSEEL